MMDPFELPEGWQDTDPSTWKPALDFGGNRIPIRLEVCAAFPSFPALLVHVYRARNQVKFALATFRGLIRQVFMHVLSAIWGNSRFGDYKNAHLLDKSDPRWLHEKEVCVCVCVHVRSMRKRCVCVCERTLHEKEVCARVCARTLHEKEVGVCVCACVRARTLQEKEVCVCVRACTPLSLSLALSRVHA